jgi:hypothetical protein
MGRRIESAREARRCLRAAEAAGQTAGEWARERGIDGRSLNAWRVNLARAARSPRLVELVPTGPAVTARYVVRIGDVSVELGDGFRDETLVRLVRALRSC